MTTYQVIISETALDAIHDQTRYIAIDRQSPDSAARWLNRVLHATETLREMPQRCNLALENAYRPYEIRTLSVASFVLLFTIDEEEKNVVVVSARHSKRLPRLDDLP